MRTVQPVSPGEMLEEEFLKPLNISVVMLASKLGLSEGYTRALLDGEVKVTPELSRRLADYFGMSEMFFYRLQEDIDSRNARIALTDSLLVNSLGYPESVRVESDTLLPV